jgi:hypothetical protein
MNDQHDLTLILKSRFPLVIIETPEEPRVLALLERITNLEEMPLFKWSVTDGIRRHNKTELLATDHLTAELKRTKPLSVVRAEEMQALREWAADRTVMAH